MHTHPDASDRDTLLVTGGAGFIGGRFVEQLLADTGVRVVNLDLLTYAGNLDSIPYALAHPRHTFVRGDIGDRGLVRELLETHRPRAVIHFAAESHVDRSIDAPAAFAATNVLGTVELLSATLAYWQALDAPARGSFRFLSVSTDEVYGSVESGAADERSAFAPNSPYAASKAAADHFVRAFHHTYGLPVLTTHGPNTYGPAQFPEKLVPLMILNALERRPLPVYGDGGNVREWLHVADHARAIRCVLAEGTPGAVYPVGGGTARTNLELVRAIRDTVERLVPDGDGASRAPIQFVADRPGHDRRYAVDAASMRALGWAPGVELDAGLEETVRWYLENPTWIERVTRGSLTTGGYRRERLGTGLAG
ncbi:MAG: dTDP-glucose 4,6-dehydratase [Pseudomonadota bacterium]|nr:dTDP-glucose 4,6-dehydratase [Pseudomonadota bacterium]